MGNQQLLVAQLISVFSALTRGADIGYRYLGCYADDPNSRDLNGLMMTIPSITVQQCANRCQQRGFAYAGLQYSNQCFCGESFGSYGASNTCNSSCSGQYCGGYLANDIYYSVDARTSTMYQRKVVGHSGKKAFIAARMDCVSANGDLTRLNKASLFKDIANATTGFLASWIGLYSTAEGSPYQWTDETGLGETYLNEAAIVGKYWDSSDPQVNLCVMFNVSTKSLNAADCQMQLPFVCYQIPPLPEAENDTTTDATTAEPSQNTAQLIALIIVLPVFFICYGGSCIIYCVYKIYIHCRQTEAESKWKNLEAMAAAAPPPPPRMPIIPYPFKPQANPFPPQKMPPPDFPFTYVPDPSAKKAVAYEKNKNGLTDRPTGGYIDDDENEVEPMGMAAPPARPTAAPVAVDKKPPSYGASNPVYVDDDDDGDDAIGPMQSTNMA